jgi:uncharacterized RDD family membrane protein YckC
MTEENQGSSPFQNPDNPPPYESAGATYDISRGKADVSKRIVAAIIDAAIASVVSLIPVAGWIIAPLYWLLRDGMDFEFMDHRSIGKKLMKLRPVTLAGERLEINHSIKRNWIFVLGGLAGIPIVGWFIILPIAIVLGVLEVVLVLTDSEGRRFGDKFAGTLVIESEA